MVRESVAIMSKIGNRQINCKRCVGYNGAMFRRVIVLFPKFEHLDSIQQLRQKYDPLAAFVPPHITLVAPFESALSSRQLEAHVHAALTEMEAFPITLKVVTGHEEEYLFLNVQRGGDE